MVFFVLEKRFNPILKWFKLSQLPWSRVLSMHQGLWFQYWFTVHIPQQIPHSECNQCQLVSAPAVLIYLREAPQCVLVQLVRPVLHYIVVSVCYATRLQRLGPPPSPTQLFSLGANRTCLQPTQLSCPPHTWKQSAFLIRTALLSCPSSSSSSPPVHQQPTFPSFLLLLLPELSTCTALPQMQLWHWGDI